MVKIENNAAVQKATLRRIAKSGSSNVSEFSDTLNAMDSAQETSQVSSTSPLNSLLFLQEVNERETAKEHGNKILDFLDRIRVNLLTGDVNEQNLMSLKSYINISRTQYSDPKIRGILDEIEQRANIELAKRGLI